MVRMMKSSFMREVDKMTVDDFNEGLEELFYTTKFMIKENIWKIITEELTTQESLTDS